MNTHEYRSSNLRKGRVSLQNTYYHIIFCTHKRQKILANKEVSSIIFNTFDWLQTDKRLEWICIMVMPDHVHSVIKLEKNHVLSKVVQSMKLFSARKINQHLSREGSLWQKGYSDWGIRNVPTLNRIIRYCYMNPVREGLVKNPGDYPFWQCIYEMV